MPPITPLAVSLRDSCGGAGCGGGTVARRPPPPAPQLLSLSKQRFVLLSPLRPLHQPPVSCTPYVPPMACRLQAMTHPSAAVIAAPPPAPACQQEAARLISCCPAPWERRPPCSRARYRARSQPPRPPRPPRRCALARPVVMARCRPPQRCLPACWQRCARCASPPTAWLPPAPPAAAAATARAAMATQPRRAHRSWSFEQVGGQSLVRAFSR